MTDNRQAQAAQAAQRMMLRGPDEVSMSEDKQPNAGGALRTRIDGSTYYDSAPLTEYPRMMYRRTEEEDRFQQTDANAKCGATYLVRNNYGTPVKPLLCDTQVANDADEAEAMAVDGWDMSPSAAYGIEDGIAKAATAKDERIAQLEAQLAEASRRKGGRPPKVVEAIAGDDDTM